MFTRIIVGIDGADGGRDALALAGRLAATDTEMVLVNAFPYERHPTRGSQPGFVEFMREDATSALRDIAPDTPGVRVRAVADTSPARALHEEAENEHADLIVVGSCHRGVVGRALLGDVSRATLHGAPCPVAVAPRGFRDQPERAFATIGVGLDRSPESHAAVAFAAALVRESGKDGTLRLLTAIPPLPAAAYASTVTWVETEAETRLAARERLAAVSASLDVPAETETSEELAGTALAQLSERVDLIVAGSRGWGAVHRVVMGSATDHLAHHAHCPVILVPRAAGVEDLASTERHGVSATPPTEVAQP